MAIKRKKSTKRKTHGNISCRRTTNLKATKVGGVRNLDELSSCELRRFHSALDAAANLHLERRSTMACAEDPSQLDIFVDAIQLFVYMISLRKLDDSKDNLSQSQAIDCSSRILNKSKTNSKFNNSLSNTNT